MGVASAAVDEVFAEPLDRVGDFTFNEQVASVFDDMVSRSVPQYGEIQRMLAELAAYFATEGSNIYDLGCSTGTTLALVHGALPVKANLIGVDNSAEMLEKCRSKLETLGLRDAVELRRADLDHGVDIRDASVVLLDGDSALLHLGDDKFLERVQSYLELSPALRERVVDIDYVDLRFDPRVYVRPAVERGRNSSPRR